MSSPNSLLAARVRRKRAQQRSPDEVKHEHKRSNDVDSVLLRKALADPTMVEILQMQLILRQEHYNTEIAPELQKLSKTTTEARASFHAAEKAYQLSKKLVDTRKNVYEKCKEEEDNLIEFAKTLEPAIWDGALPYAYGGVQEAVEENLPGISLLTEQNIMDVNVQDLKNLIYSLFEGGIALNRELRRRLNALLTKDDPKLETLLIKSGAFREKRGRGSGGLEINPVVGDHRTGAEVALRIAMMLGVEWTEANLGKPFCKTAKTSPMKSSRLQDQHMTERTDARELFASPGLGASPAVFASPVHQSNMWQNRELATPRSALSQQPGVQDYAQEPQQGVSFRLSKKLGRCWEPKDVEHEFQQGVLRVHDGHFLQEIDFNGQSISAEAIYELFCRIGTLSQQCVSIDASNMLATMTTESARNDAVDALATKIVKKCRNLKDLILRNANLGNLRLLMLKEVTELEKLEGIDVSKCGLSDLGCLRDVLEVLPNLKRLFLSGNVLCSTASDIEVLGALVSHHKHLEMLGCGNLTRSMEGGVDFSPFFHGLNVLSSNGDKAGRLKYLDISAMEIGTNQVFASALTQFDQLEALILDYTCIASDETMYAIFKALKGKASLRVLKLEACLVDRGQLGPERAVTTGLTRFFKYMPDNMEELVLAYMRLTTEAVQGCLEALTDDDCSLQKLDLSGNSGIDENVVGALTDSKLGKLQWVNVGDTSVRPCGLMHEVFHFGETYNG